MYDFDYCMTELAEHEGVSMDIQTPRESGEQQDMSNLVLFQDFVDLMPKIAEANAVSDELKRVNATSITLYVNVHFKSRPY